jgi:RimJ/RimL family protein N-acetyltransferase
MLPTEIRTARLLLRRQRPEDAALIKDAIDTSLPHLKASVGWARNAPFPLPTFVDRLAESAAAFDAGTQWAFSILDPSGNRVFGGAALEPAEAAVCALVGSGVFETGYWLRADATGHGYATEATSALIDLAFTRLGAQRVVICHDPDNSASAGVPRRLGFRELGVVPNTRLPDRQAADGSVRRATKVWVFEAPREGASRTPSVAPPA